ncbi:phage terminase large subunit [Enterococcus avium]|uniref:phage terminase large subunit n=1 Tax=Enterococcus avium TaxID=33945 RepID=UPI00288E8021|nr:phage terminase large subunit [Enterococcus avium]MDT2437000.1 phage terminase large subunit [Enterococcus avium]MDT2511691.1 phage terminase large subunit [Enterococcus avium]
MKKSTTLDRVEYAIVQRELAIRKARGDFWLFCQLLYPEFYKDDRLYLKDLCQTLQDFYEDKIDKKILVINMPPRHGKTFTARLFVLWMFGQNPRTKIITGSYNQILSSLFAQQTRDGIMVDNENIKAEYFKDIFPKVQIKYGDAAKGFWSLDGSEEKNYLATSPGGTSTGIGANYVIVDDIIKTAEEAYNERVLDSHWEWYNNTLAQRMERPRKQILIMTRWSNNDLAGKMLNKRKNSVHQICYKAVQDDESMLCEEIMTHDEYLDVIQEMNLDIAEANYQQEPIDQKGKLYQNLKTYGHRSEYKKIWSYCDTADTGKDYLCSIVWGETSDGRCEVLDVIYTQEPMEYTESAVSNQYINNKVNQARIERNNGGRSFARSVREKIKDKCPVAIDDFYQSANKEARIYSNTAWIEQNVYFPEDWRTKWPEYYSAMTTYQREGKNKHDDAPDATTGIAETMSMNVKEKVNVKKTINTFKKLGL